MCVAHSVRPGALPQAGMRGGDARRSSAKANSERPFRGCPEGKPPDVRSNPDHGLAKPWKPPYVKMRPSVGRVSGKSANTRI